MAGHLLIVSGAPGVGKSTLAKAIARAWDAPAALNIHSDDFWTWFAKGFIPPWLPESLDQNIVVTRAMAAAAVEMAKAYPVVFDGIVGPWFVDIFADAARAGGVRLDYLVVRPDRATTVARGTGREGHPMRDANVIGDMWDHFADVGAYEAHVIDNSGMDLPASVEHVRRAIEAGRLRLV